MAYIGDLEGELFDIFMTAAKLDFLSMRYSFLHTSDTSCADIVGASAPGIGATRNFDDSPVGYTGGADLDEIVEWAKNTAIPKMIEFSENYIDEIFYSGKPALLLFSETYDMDYHKEYEKAADILDGEILFVTSGISEGI